MNKFLGKLKDIRRFRRSNFIEIKFIFGIFFCYMKNWISFYCLVEREDMMLICNLRMICQIFFIFVVN